jgi:hypothetical protein
MKAWLTYAITMTLGLACGWCLRSAVSAMPKTQQARPSQQTKAATVAQKPAEKIESRILQIEELRMLLCSSVDSRELHEWCALLSVEELESYLLTLKNQSLEDNEMEMLGVMCALAALGQKDWDKALTFAKSWGDDFSDTAVGYLLGDLASRDAADGTRLLQQYKLANTWAEGAFYLRWLEQDATAVLHYWDEHPETGSSTHSLHSYAQLCPVAELPALASAAATLKRRDLASSAVHSVLQVWSLYQPAAALSFAAQYAQRSGEEQDFLGQLSRRFHLAEDSPQELMQVTASLHAGATRTALSKALVSNLLSHGESKLLDEWLRTHPDEQAARGMLEHPLLPASEEAIRLLAGHLIKEEDQQALLSQGAITLARSADVDSALALLKEVTIAEPRETAVHEIAQRWYRHEPAAALQWAQSLGTQSERDAAISGLAQVMIEMDPAQAAPWVSSLQNVGRRNFLMKELSRAWQVADSTGLKQWLQAQPGMNSVLRAEMLKGL